jgi:6-methylsalicylate decarboxylase
VPGLSAHWPNGLAAELAKFYYEISNSADPATLAVLQQFAPVSHILFGTDSPYTPARATTASFERLALTGDVRHAIERGNALALFPRLATGTTAPK